MSEPTAQAHAAPHHHVNYVKIWAILLCLLVVSVAGPFLGNLAITLITAFGIAIVKAYLVAKNFMHLDIEKKFVSYLLATMLILMALMFGGISPDVMKHEGQRWNNDAAKAATARGLAQSHEAGGGHAGAHPASEHH